MKDKQTLINTKSNNYKHNYQLSNNNYNNKRKTNNQQQTEKSIILIVQHRNYQAINQTINQHTKHNYKI